MPSNRSQSKQRRRPTDAPPNRWRLIGILLVLTVAVTAAGFWLKVWPFRRESPTANLPSPSAGPLSFNRDIAPIVFGNCSGCHRPGESAPFSLLTYADVKRHARDIVDVTRRRYMPPWLPEPGHEPLQDERRLTEVQIQALARWLAEGTVEGQATDLPALPKFPEGWQLGPPDLVVTMPEAYTLGAAGPDVYRNFVLPVPTQDRRLVKAFEFRPGSRAVHHAFIRIDGTRQARRLDEQEPGPGFGGMDIPPSSESPLGYFLSWQPGRRPGLSPEGMPWTLPAGADVVLLMHMQPQGRPETLQPRLGFYFTESPPTNTPIKIGLRSYAMDIPPGASDYAIEESASLTADATLLALMPHAHYLGKRLEGFVTLPNGQRQTLLSIPHWDFNWQSDFRFVHPVALPRGSKLGMRYIYDNSTNNPRNPHSPPRRTGFGLQTTDEMGELWFQLVARNQTDLERLGETAQIRMLQDIESLSRLRLRQNPADTESMAELGKVFLARGDASSAEALFRQAIGLNPKLDDVHYHLGLVLLDGGRPVEAEIEFVEALRLNPGHFQARNNLGLCCLRQERMAEAAQHFREVLRLHPKDTVAQKNLALAEQKLGRRR